MKLGYFDNPKREYVITTPILPARWINYIGTLNFGGFVDHTGGGVVCCQDPALNRITKYIMQLPASEMNGETCYVRIHTENGYELFSPFYTPVCKDLDSFECRVGLFYSLWKTMFKGILCEILVFVPEKFARVIRKYKITNTSAKTISLDIIPVVEYSHFDALKNLTNSDWVPQTMQSRLEKGPAGLKLLTQYAFMKRDIACNFFTSSIPFSSFETDRSRFLGNWDFGTWQNPLALQEKSLSNYEANRGHNIAALLLEIGSLKPGESKEFLTQLGQTDNLQAEWEKISYYNDFKNITEAFTAQEAFWDDYLNTIQVNTPDEAMNTMLNIYHPRQCFITFNWSRDLSLYQLGYGGRGHGFRDSAQDSLGVLASIPEKARSLIEKLLQVQCRDGHAMHQFYPLTMEANAGDSRSHPDRPSYYSDDHLWIILSVTGYLKETGNLDFLKKPISFYDHDEKGNVESASVFEHLKRALQYTKTHRGAHGLPLLGFADWNDTVNLPAGAESFFTACLYGRALLEMIELCKLLGEDKLAQQYEADYSEMKNCVNEHCWDGEWYICYFTAEAEPLGSKKSFGSKIYILPQSWAVLAGFAPAERAKLALESANKLLATDWGYKLSAPSFNGYDEKLGGISTYPPGTKENGGIFLHTNPWFLIAETMLGNGNLSFDIYNRINPVTKNEIIEKYEMEPYCYAQNILGDEHPEHGKARNSWLSGTASWMYQAAIQYILGLRPTYHGLQVDPCLPAHWEKVSIKRRWRGAFYEIAIENPKGLQKGRVRLKVNNQKIEGCLIPYAKPGEIVKVEVELA